MRVRLVCAVMALLYLVPAQAESEGFFLGGSYLNNHTEFGSDSDSDGGYEFGLGYSLNDRFAAEFSYFDFGTHSLPTFPDAGGKIDADGTALQVIAKYPLDTLTLYGKLGRLWWDRDGRLTTIAGPVPFGSDGSDWLYGVGCSYGITEGLDVRFEYKVSQFDDDDLRSVAVGLTVSF